MNSDDVIAFIVFAVICLAFPPIGAIIAGVVAVAWLVAALAVIIDKLFGDK